MGRCGLSVDYGSPTGRFVGRAMDCPLTGRPIGTQNQWAAHGSTKAVAILI